MATLRINFSFCKHDVQGYTEDSNSCREKDFTNTLEKSKIIKLRSLFIYMFLILSFIAFVEFQHFLRILKTTEY